MKRMLAGLAASLLIAVGAPRLLAQQAAAPAAQSEKPYLWLYWHTGLASDQNLTKSIEMVQRMKKAGYTGIAYLDNQFHRINQWDAHYESNLKKFRQACTDNQMDLVATVLPLGYANDIMIADPNLAEAIPVENAPFVVKGGKLVPDDDVKLVNGTFEQNSDKKLVGWSIDKPGVACFVDTKVTYQGKPSVRMEDIQKNGEFDHARGWQPLKVKPFRAYHLSVAVKTENYKPGDVRLMALGSTDGKEHSGHPLNLPTFNDVKSTQDWTIYHKTFNTQDCDNVAIYVGDWGGRTGKIWFADVKMEPVGLSNIVRRGGAPFKATMADGTTVLQEGTDLPKMVDPMLGNAPHLGGYQWHDGPTLQIPSGSRLKEGDKVLLSYATTHVMEYNDQVPICMSEPKTYELIDKIVAHTQEHLKPDYWFMEHDETRMQGWDKSCVDTGKTCGGIQADNIAKCTAIIRKYAPQAKGLYVWSDLFDPFHNAGYKGEYFAMCKGINPWDKSWEGLPKEVGLINWNAAKPDSVAFFSKEGHPQVLSNVSPGSITQILQKSGKDPGVKGAIYVTWGGDFSNNVEKYAQAVLNWYKQQGK